MIYIIYDSGVFSFTLSRFFFYVLCVIDISLFDCGCDRGLIFRKDNSRSDYVFNSGIIVRSGELQEIH
jgi:hypothetical protein